VGVVLNKSTWSLSSLFGTQGVALWMNIAAILLVFFWVVAIIRTTKDIINRTNSFSLQVISILLVTFLTPLI
jgi:glucan phosphoethanolaminetransferase (alkaline phosphatase superfamily)